MQIAKSPLAAETSGLVTETRFDGTVIVVNRLGDLERAIMEVLWQTDSALTVRQVSNGLTQSLAHTTVMTVLDRLAKKGFARRERDGRAWRYRPAATREAYVAELMLTALEQTGDRDAALARFAQSVSGAEAEVLREALSGLEREQQDGRAVRGRQRDRIMGALADAVLLAAVAVGSVRCARDAARAAGRAGPRRPRFCCGRPLAWRAASPRRRAARDRRQRPRTQAGSSAG